MSEAALQSGLSWAWTDETLVEVLQRSFSSDLARQLMIKDLESFLCVQTFVSLSEGIPLVNRNLKQAEALGFEGRSVQGVQTFP